MDDIDTGIIKNFSKNICPLSSPDYRGWDRRRFPDFDWEERSCSLFDKEKPHYLCWFRSIPGRCDCFKVYPRCVIYQQWRSEQPQITEKEALCLGLSEEDISRLKARPTLIANTREVVYGRIYAYEVEALLKVREIK